MDRPWPVILVEARPDWPEDDGAPGGSAGTGRQDGTPVGCSDDDRPGDSGGDPYGVGAGVVAVVPEPSVPVASGSDVLGASVGSGSVVPDDSGSASATTPHGSAKAISGVHATGVGESVGNGVGEVPDSSAG